MDIEHEYIVVGSGCTGAMAAQTLIEKGVKVLMLDVGEHDDRYQNTPQENFTEIRKTDPQQYKYWLGGNFESISLNKTSTGAQLTPARKHMLRNTEKYLSVVSSSFIGMESLSYGGLGNGWGVGCCVFSDEELKAAGLSIQEMRNAYQVVADRIGISGENDDATPYTSGDLQNLQKTQDVDVNSKVIYQKYSAKKQSLNQIGFYMGKPALALLTEKKEERQPVDYTEMDFYSDKNESAYRPWITVNKLKKNPNFQYTANSLVLSFKEEDGKVTVNYLDTTINEQKKLTCKKLILCSGTLGTARIALRSANVYDKKLPLLCNPYKYFTLLQPSRLGKATNEPRTAFAQLAMYLDPSHTNYEVSASSIYSYRSLMLFRTVKEVPLNFRDARTIMQYLLPAMTIMGVHHPDHICSSKYVELASANSPTGDKLKIEYSPSDTELAEINKRDKLYSAAMRKLGCYTLKKLNPGYGASVHYAGCLPFSEEEKPLHISSSGRIMGTKNVFAGDGSGFKYLPAKGITLSIMAFAHLTALNSLSNQ